MTSKLLLAAAVAASISFSTPDRAPEPAEAPAQYSILFMEPAQGFADRNGPKAKAYWDKWSAYIGSVQASGKMTSGNAIQAPSTGRVLGPAREVGGQRLRVSGYIIVNASSLEEAVQLAEKSPAVADGGAVDVRPLLPMQDHKGATR